MAKALKASGQVARVTWLGRVADRASGLASAAVDRLDLGFDGAAGEAHAGRTRAACGRVSHLHPAGTEIANTRQLTMLSAEDLADTAAAMGVARLPPEAVGASIVVAGLADLTHLPPSSRLQGPDGVTLVVDMENLPCSLAAKSVEAVLPGAGRRYKTAARGRRGVTLWVERPGRLALGDGLALFVPAQRGWQG